MLKWLVTNPLGWVILGAGAVYGLVKAIDAVTESAEEAGEAATAAKEKYTKIESEIDSLNSKIEENNKLIAETNGEAKYDGYRKRLELENKELERQIQLERIKAQEANSEADEKATKALTSETYEYDVEYEVDAAGFGYSTTSQKGDIADATDWYLDQAEATGVVSDTLKDYIAIITEQRENLDLSNPESKALYDSLGLLIDRYIALYPNVKVTSDEMANTSENIDEVTASLTLLEKASDNIKPLGTAFKELDDDGYISIKTLKEIKDAADLSSEEWTEYEANLLKAKVGSSEFNQIMSDLTYKILDNTFASADLNNLTEQQVAATLRENGVVNASAVAHDWLAKAKAKEKIASMDLVEGSELDIKALANEASACGVAKNAYLELVAKEIIFNRNDLDVEDKVKKLNQIAIAAGVAGINMDNLNSKFSSQDAKNKYVEDSGGKVVTKTNPFGTSFQRPLSWMRPPTDGIIEYELPDGTKTKDFNEYYLSVEISKVAERIAGAVNNLTIPDFTGAPNKNEALDNYLKAAENRYKIHQDEAKYVQDLQYAYNNLTKSEEERLDIINKINEARKDEGTNQIKDIEHQIYLGKELYGEDFDATDYYDQIQTVAHEEADRYREFARKELGYYDEGVTDEQKAQIDADIENTDEIQGLQKAWWDAQNNKLDFPSNQHKNNIRNIEHARDMALANDENTDVVPYYKQLQAEYHKEAERLRAIDPEKYKEEIQNLQLEWWKAEEAIVEYRKDAMEKSISDIDDYIDARNTYNDWEAYGDSEVKAIQRQTKIIEDAYKQRLISYEEYVDRMEEQTQRIYSLGQDQVDKHLSNIDKYIDARNHYNDWDDFNDSEIESIKRQCAVLDEAYRLNLISLEDYTEKSAEYTKKLYSVAKENIIETVSELVEDYEEIKQLESSKLESQKTLLQSYYDVTNAIAEAQHEINKELKASMTMHEYLNEDTRELLFNQEDYNALNEELLNIQAEADELQRQYQEDILNANAETIAEITEQYQMQYQTLMKQYEISKAELEVAKKRQKLDNVLAERNTRMFINGQWQWVANTQDVINAQNELADAEIERKKQEAALEQTVAINSFTTQINSLETDLNKVRKYWTDMQEMLNGESDEVAKALREISNVSSPELKRIVEATGGNISSFSTSLSNSTTTLSTIINSDLGNMSVGISAIITDLQNYSLAIQALTEKTNGKVLQVGADGNAPAGATIGDTIVTAGGNYKIVAANTPGASYNPESGHWSVKVGESSGKTVQVGSDGNAPSGTKVGDVVKTAGGNYLVVSPNTRGASYNPTSGLWSIKIDEKDANGTRYTSGGMTLMGEEGFEAFVSNTGRLIPISRPTIGNVGAGGIVFNREQMANLRTLWDWSNLGKMSSYISSSNANNQNTVIDNSIHINGLTVGEQGNEDWINGLRRYVATHK